MSEPWTVARIEELKRLHDLDYSCSRIAAALRYVTRNAVIGKLHRLGIRGPRSNVPRIPKIKKDRPKRSSNNHQSVFKIVMNGSGPHLLESRLSLDDLKLRCAEIDPLGLALLELEDGSCRYPYGDNPREMTFCGHLKIDGSSYCFGHFRLTRSEGTASERRATETVRA